MNLLLKKLSLFHYNIGFFNLEATNLLQGKVDVEWMKYPYKDRFFADPFILSVSETEIRVLVEDFEYNRWKGNISLLIVSRKDFSLQRKKTLLDLDTHLSFPFIVREGERVYVVPENSAAGRLTAYRYVEEDEHLEKVSVLTELPVIDPVVHRDGDKFRLFGSLCGKEENGQLYEWESDELLQGYRLVTDAPIKTGWDSSRRAGDFFRLNAQLYAATQCCTHSYGEAMNICKVDAMGKGKLKESAVATIKPRKEYSYGLHTLNMHDDVCVVDGLTFLFRPIEKIARMIKMRKG